MNTSTNELEIKQMAKYILVNNTCQDIRFLKPHFDDFILTGVLHDDISDLFKVYIVKSGESIKLIIDMADDQL
jgi:hypothetical protein